MTILFSEGFGVLINLKYIEYLNICKNVFKFFLDFIS